MPSPSVLLAEGVEVEGLDCFGALDVAGEQARGDIARSRVSHGPRRISGVGRRASRPARGDGLELEAVRGAVSLDGKVFPTP